MNPEDFESPEFDLFKTIIDAFVKKYPGVEHGPNHVIFGDYNLEKDWLVSAQIKIRDRNGPGPMRLPEMYDSETNDLLTALITICELLEIE